MNSRQLLAPAGAVALVLAMTSSAGANDPGIADRDVGDHLAIDRTEVSLDTANINDPDEVIEVFVRLDEPAVTEYVAQASLQRRPEPSAQQRRSQAQRVERQHDRFRSEMDASDLDVDEQSSMKVGANGLRMRAKARDIPEIAELPEVLSVAPVELHEPTNHKSVPWINTPEAWDFLDFTGEGIIISVIDTGIDYTHASFGGSGEVADYEFILEDTTIIPEVDGEPVFPTAKVVNGFDFAGVDYNAGGTPEQQIPQPDPNPLDVHGHGSHVAGSAAGVEVTDDDDDIRVGSGVAPDALLYAAKVFGDIAGSTAVTADAIEWSLDPNGDGSMEGQAHVINMSLGNVFGHPDDPSAIAAQNAAEVGTVVVASAGNEGQTAAYVTGAPAVAPGAISVAASVDDGFAVLALEVHEPEAVAGTYEAAESGTSTPLAETGPVAGELAVADPLIACEEDEDGNEVPRIDNPEELAGKIAVVQRGLCSFTLKHQAVQDAGAIAILVYNNAAGDPIVMGGDPTGIEIPGVMISLADGELLKEQLDAGETVTATMSADTVIPKPELADTLAPFTSRGPGRTSSFKPDVAAPGFGIFSAAVGSGDRARSSSGTSMAAPHVAGLAALMAHQHGLPDLDGPAKGETVQAIKSLIMNTTVPASEFYPLALQGTGVVRADQAVTADAYTSPAGLSFGRLHPLEPTTVTETVTVTNLSDASRTFGVGFEVNQDVPGVTVSHDSSVTVGANGTASFDVTLTLDPAAMPPDAGFFSQTEIDGWLVLDDGELTLRNGVLAVVDPAAAVDVTTLPSAVLDPTIDLAVSNDSLTTGLSDGMTLVGAGDAIGGVIEGVGVQTGVLSGTDVVQFGLATSDGWDSLSTRETQILLDVDSDGEFDYALVAADLGLLQNVDPDGRVVTALFDLNLGGATLQWFVDGDYHDQVQVLTVDRFPPFGFLDEGGSQSFDYLALHFIGDDLVGVQDGSVDLETDADGLDNPALAVPAGVSGVLSFPKDDQRDMLWLHQSNLLGDQFQVVALDAPGCDTTITGTHVGPLKISDGVTCLVDGGRVIGPVTVQAGAGLAASGASVTGPVTANGAAIVELDDTRITGPLTVRGVTDSVMLIDNHISGPVKVRDNSTGDRPIVVSGNRIVGPLSCTGNEPPPVNDGSPNNVTGPKSGQCADL